jgi:hypothetical protein
MEKSKPSQNPIPLKVDWSEAERAAWAPLEGRELSIDLARRKLRQLQADAEGFHMQLQVIRGLLDADQPGGGRG